MNLLRIITAIILATSGMSLRGEIFPDTCDFSGSQVNHNYIKQDTRTGGYVRCHDEAVPVPVVIVDEDRYRGGYYTPNNDHYWPNY